MSKLTDRMRRAMPKKNAPPPDSRDAQGAPPMPETSPQEQERASKYPMVGRMMRGMKKPKG